MMMMMMMMMIMMMMMMMITYLTRVNPSAEAIINGCPGQLKDYHIKEKK